MIDSVLLQLPKLGQANRSLGFSHRARQYSDARTGSDGVNHFHIESRFFCPSAPFVAGIICWHVQRRKDLNRDRWQAELLVKYIHILLQCGTPKRIDDHNSLPLTAKSLLEERLDAIS